MSQSSAEAVADRNTATRTHHDLYRALPRRYRPAYEAASMLKVGGFFLLLTGTALIMWGVSWWDVGPLWQQNAVPTLLVAGFATLVVGGVLSVVAPILRAALDRTAIAAPGLDAAERILLAYQAGGQQDGP